MKVVHLFPEHNTAILYEPADDSVVVTNGIEHRRYHGTFGLTFESKKYKIVNDRQKVTIYDQVTNSEIATFLKEAV